MPGHTGELARRPARTPDYAAENHALVGLARAQAGSRPDLLQAIADAALSLCSAGSAGISLIEQGEGKKVFRWLAVSGLCVGLQGKTTAWDECPCGIALEAGTAQLFVEPQAQFPSLSFPGICVPEGVVVPINVAGRDLGAIWVMSHRDDCRFDFEDARLLSNLAVFAGSSLTIVDARELSEESERRQNDFIAMLAHELRNPMAPIDSAIGAAKRLCADNQRATGVLDIAERQMRHLRTLVDDLLDAARLQHGKLAIKLSDTSLNDITFDALSAVRHHIEARKHKLTITGLEDQVPVRADHVRLSQVLGNLLSNAAKYTAVGGDIRLNISVGACGSDDGLSGSVLIEIQDNGIGLESTARERIFDLFTQGASESARAEGGLGIGLAVARRMVELHGGEITLHSDGPGCGTMARLRLPILMSTADRHIARQVKPRVGTKRARLLVVDDNRDALEALEILLEVEGYEVATSDNGADAIRLMSEHHPTVALIDVGMPVMDGFEVARAVRLDPRFNDVLLVALTGYAAESDKSRALAAGFDFHLTKPLSLDKLERILSRQLDAGLGHME
ncbi:hybrid sensor histidine kinase/response regulator [Paraburkholderia fynbosensis]|uniref:histidine kinase n=1 Tax=Paraburkholderia fynbosensis TaxID=1200993 RepID=A0A6J5H193_9BURK|nr:ATP-binding protein [Paraburkholderia fynbosensis]CAB3810678.1 Sensor histidine kinase RcsC [Paraburkholderia fynbosensis]